jgi:hypothetical protein
VLQEVRRKFGHHDGDTPRVGFAETGLLRKTNE